MSSPQQHVILGPLSMPEAIETIERRRVGKTFSLQQNKTIFILFSSLTGVRRVKLSTSVRCNVKFIIENQVNEME